MMGLKIDINRDIKIMCLGAHCDDIEIGCGGTMLSILNKYRHAEVYWVVFSSDPMRENEARSSADIFLESADVKTIEVRNFRNGYFPYAGNEIKDYFENFKVKYSPDIIFTHYSKDFHQDHRIISELTWNTFRNNFILEYEIPKYDGDFGTPNFFVSLESYVCNTKVNTILNCFKTQGDKHWLTEDLLYSTLRIRGMECCSLTNYAEAFYCRKAIINIK